MAVYSGSLILAIGTEMVSKGISRSVRMRATFGGLTLPLPYSLTVLSGDDILFVWCLEYRRCGIWINGLG